MAYVSQKPAPVGSRGEARSGAASTRAKEEEEQRAQVNKFARDRISMRNYNVDPSIVAHILIGDPQMTNDLRQFVVPKSPKMES